jgi:hypothetical protein
MTKDCFHLHAITLKYVEQFKLWKMILFLYLLRKKQIMLTGPIKEKAYYLALFFFFFGNTGDELQASL